MHYSTDVDRQYALENCITKTSVDALETPYRGKVREVYELNNDKLGIVVTDRISAFDHIMKQAIPFKGQILNQLAAHAFNQVEDLVNTHLIDVPHPNVSIARACEPIPIEVVMRGCLTGHAWRVYNSGQREVSGVQLSDGLRKNETFEEPILTPATKAEEGHDEDISEKEILDRGIVAPPLWNQIRNTAFKLFKRGRKKAAEQGLILVDTKYEFGLYEDELVLIDEVHTPDSSRFFYADEYEERLNKGKDQKQLSKEFLREWLMDQGFKGKEGQTLPDLPDDFRWKVFERYAELYQMLTGQLFQPEPISDFNQTLEEIFRPHI